MGNDNKRDTWMPPTKAKGRVRVALWTTRTAVATYVRVVSYVTERGAEGHIPDAHEDLCCWLNVGWRYAPLSYFCTDTDMTVIVLEHEVT